MRAFVAGALATMLLAASCTADARDPEPPAEVTLTWRAVALPAPPGTAGRIAIRSATTCPQGDWYLVGGIVGADGQSRPAAWHSRDGATWRSLPFTFLPSSYYGPRSVVYAVACTDTSVAMLGGQSGGAHGNPRLSTWYLGSDGVLVEVPAAFTQYGGEDAVNTARMVAGERGLLMTGNRTSGAAVWISADGREFRLIEAAPGLASDAAAATWANDALAVRDGWVVVGAGTTGANRDPLTWTSPDGVTWRRVPVPGDATYEELQRVAVVGGEVVAVGLRGATFGAWRAGAAGDAWRAGGRFGATDGGPVADVRSLAVAGDRLVASANDGARYSLWISTDRGERWQPAALPVAAPSGSERNAVVVGAAGRLLLLVDDGTDGRVWLADVSG